MKQLILEKIDETADYIIFIVAKQSHFGEDFGINGSKFKHPGLTLFSAPRLLHAYWDPCQQTLCLAGKLHKCVDIPIVIVKGDWDKLKAAIDDYNDCFKDWGNPQTTAGDYKGITETIKIQVGAKSADITRFISAPPIGMTVYTLESNTYVPHCVRKFVYDGAGVAFNALGARLLFPTAADVKAFLNVII